MHPKKVSEIGAKWSQFGAVSETRSLTILQTRAFTLIGTAKRRKKKREERKKVFEKSNAFKSICNDCSETVVPRKKVADQNRLFATGKDSIEKSKADVLARDGEEITTLSKFLLEKK